MAEKLIRFIYIRQIALPVYSGHYVHMRVHGKMKLYDCSVKHQLFINDIQYWKYVSWE
jgi:hypothetical protein